jgi:hypothetical protein
MQHLIKQKLFSVAQAATTKIDVTPKELYTFIGILIAAG